MWDSKGVVKHHGGHINPMGTPMGWLNIKEAHEFNGGPPREWLNIMGATLIPWGPLWEWLNIMGATQIIWGTPMGDPNGEGVHSSWEPWATMAVNHGGGVVT